MRRLLNIGLLLVACAAAVCARQPGPAAKNSLRAWALKINVEEMDRALSFYVEKLGFEVADRSGYPREVVLKTADSFRLILNKVGRLQADGTFAFMIHYRPGVAPIESRYPAAAPFVTLVFAAHDLARAFAALKRAGVKVLATETSKRGKVVVI